MEVIFRPTLRSLRRRTAPFGIGLALAACNPLSPALTQSAIDSDHLPGLANTSTPAALVLSITPSQGGAGGGTSVLIAGSGFKLGDTITLGGSTCTSPTVVSAMEITCTTPAHSAGAVDVVVTHTNAAAGTLSLGFTYTLNPDAPTGLSAVPGNAQVGLTWTAPGGAGPYTYTIKRSTTSGSGYTDVATGVSGTSYTDTSPTNGTTYYYVVTATDTNGTSSASSEASATPLAAPAAFAFVSATGSNAQVALVWGASARASTYTVKRGTASGVYGTTVATGIAATTYTDTSLANGTTYYYQVTAVGVGGTTVVTAEITGTPPLPTAAQSTVSTSAASVTADGTTTATITVTLRDAGSTGVSGRTVALTSSRGATDTVSAASGVSDASGVVTFTVKSSTSGSSTFTATDSTDSVTVTQTASVSFVAGTATKLAYDQGPSNAVAGASVSPAITVRVLDANNNLVTTDSSTQVTLAIGTNTAASTLSGTLTQTASSGIATFSNISLNKVGTGYTLTATSSPALTGVTSSAFNITAGTAAKLGFGTQPGGGTAATTWGTQPVVRILDANDNIVTSNSTASVTLTIDTNAGLGTLSGTATVTASSGVATFAGLSIDKSGTGYTLAASSAGLTGTVSSTFNIAAGSATKLAFATQPGGGTASSAWATQPIVRILDANDNIVTSNSSTSVTVAIGTNAGSGTLSGTAAVTAASGVVTYAGLKINKSGTGYTLTASSAGLTSATSSTFDITAAAASKLAFSTQPGGGTGGSAWSTQPVVKIYDADDNLITTDSTTQVTVAIGTNAGGGALSGTASVTAASGVVTFAGLSINLIGTGYTLIASSAGLTSATSSAFNIVAGVATQLAFATQPGGGKAGSAWSTQPVVEIRDAGGNKVTSGADATATVTLTLTTGTGALSGTAAIAAVGGAVTYSDLVGSQVGTNKVLTATKADTSGSGGVGSLTTTSNAFTITADRLTYTTQPANKAAGGTLTAFVIKATDSAGGVDTTFTGDIAIAISSNSNGATVSGTSPVTAVAGVSSFSDISVNKVCVACTFAATATGLSGATSSSFNITGDRLTYTTQPSGTTTGLRIPTFVVKVTDSSGDVDTTATPSVAIAVSGASASLGGNSSETASNGVATFRDTAIDRAGSFTLVASYASYTSATSNSFTVTDPSSIAGTPMLNLDANKYNGTSAGSGTCNAATWTNLVSGATQNGTLTNIGTTCDGSSGWSSSPERLDFDGTNDYVALGSGSAFQARILTISLWMQRKGNANAVVSTGSGGITNAEPIVAKQMGEADGSTVDGNYFFGFDQSTSKIFHDSESYASGANSALSSASTLSNNTWYHIAVMYDPVTLQKRRLYINGSLDAEETKSVDARYDSIQYPALGANRNSSGTMGGSYFKGSMSSVQIYNTGLSGDLIRQNCRMAASRFTGRTCALNTSYPVPATSQSAVTVSSTSLGVSSTSTITLTAKDSGGTALDSSPTSNYAVTFDYDTTSGTSTGTIGAVTDNGDGTFSATFTGTGAGTAVTIRAYINGSLVTGGSTRTITVSTPSTSLSTLAVANSSIYVTGRTAFTITLRDSNNTAYSASAGGSYTITADYDTGSGSATGTMSSVTDNNNGTYTAYFTGATTGTAVTMRAYINGVQITSSTPTVTVTTMPSGLLAHYRADALAYANGASVSAWANSEGTAARDLAVSTGASSPAVVGASPTYVSTNASINSKPSVQFNGSTQYLVQPAVAAAMTGLTTATILAVAKGSTVSGSHNLVSFHDSTGNSNLIRMGYSASKYWMVPSSNTAASGTTAVSGWAYLTGIFKNNANSMRVNGSLEVSANSAMAFGSFARFSVGQEWDTNTASDFYSGDIAEIIIYDHELTGSDLTDVETYLKNKYGL